MMDVQQLHFKVVLFLITLPKSVKSASIQAKILGDNVLGEVQKYDRLFRLTQPLHSDAD
jgi:hypothetical protein